MSVVTSTSTQLVIGVTNLVQIQGVVQDNFDCGNKGSFKTTLTAAAAAAAAAAATAETATAAAAIHPQYLPIYS